MKELVRFIPAVHELQKSERFTSLLQEKNIDMTEATILLKEVLQDVRASLLHHQWNGSDPGTSSFLQEILDRFEKKLFSTFTYTLKPVINATGTILHTNLGRARLSSTAIKHVTETALQYSNLEYQVDAGERGSRHVHVEDLIKQITGAEAAMVVNNNAAAVFLVLRALAENKKVIVSRGQLVEIGGSFRISSIMEESGATLVEVGTTNKTHLIDYSSAIDEETAILMKVHTSNFAMIGFTKSVETHELVELARQHEELLVYEDLGSGALYDFRKHGIGSEPHVREVLENGVHLVSFSGDKLLGGPQAGIIAGKKKYIDKLKKHQLARVLRVDKMTLAALEGTLVSYAKGEKAIKEIPVVRDILCSKESLRKRSEIFANELRNLSTEWRINIQETTGQVGGGTMPEVELPTVVVGIRHPNMNASTIAKKLRVNHTPPIIVRIQKDEVWIDLRTVTKEEETILLDGLVQIK